jgi:glutamate carboxypeptidase
VREALLAHRVAAGAARRRGEVLGLLGELAALDAPSGDVELLDATADVLEARLGALGLEVRRIDGPAGAHLEARTAGAGAPIAILGHYDTVWAKGTAGERPFRVQDGVAHGPGVFDMRGGIVAALTALAVLRDLDALDRPVTVLLTADEETGSVTSQQHIVRVGREARAVLIPEPPMPGGGLKTQRKGVLSYGLRVTGRSAHAGLDPERGISAISELVALAGDVERAASSAEGTTVNVGLIAGGTRSNVVAAAASAEVDVRVATMGEYERMTAFFAGLGARLPGASLEVELLHARPPLERTAAIAGAVARARGLAALLGFDLGEGSAGGGSDGNFLAPLGVAVLDGLGPDGGGAHALDEHVLLDSLEQRVALIAVLVALL